VAEESPSRSRSPLLPPPLEAEISEKYLEPGRAPHRLHEDEERGQGADRERTPLQRLPVRKPPTVRAQKNCDWGRERCKEDGAREQAQQESTSVCNVLTKIHIFSAWMVFRLLLSFFEIQTFEFRCGQKLRRTLCICLPALVVTDSCSIVRYADFPGGTCTGKQTRACRLSHPPSPCFLPYTTQMHLEHFKTARLGPGPATEKQRPLPPPAPTDKKQQQKNPRSSSHSLGSPSIPSSRLARGTPGSRPRRPGRCPRSLSG